MDEDATHARQQSVRCRNQQVGGAPRPTAGHLGVTSEIRSYQLDPAHALM